MLAVFGALFVLLSAILDLATILVVVAMFWIGRDGAVYQGENISYVMLAPVAIPMLMFFNHLSSAFRPPHKIFRWGFDFVPSVLLAAVVAITAGLVFITLFLMHTLPVPPMSFIAVLAGLIVACIDDIFINQRENAYETLKTWLKSGASGVGTGPAPRRVKLSELKASENATAAAEEVVADPNAAVRAGTAQLQVQLKVLPPKYASEGES